MWLRVAVPITSVYDTCCIVRNVPSAENKEFLMFDSEPVPFFQSPGQVNPRDEKYVVRKG